MLSCLPVFFINTIKIENKLDLNFYWLLLENRSELVQKHFYSHFAASSGSELGHRKFFNFLRKQSPCNNMNRELLFYRYCLI